MTNEISVKQKIHFAHNLAVMLEAGLSVTEALDVLADQTTGKWRKMITEITVAITAGNTLSSALGKYPKLFSGSFVDAVRVGEVSGNLSHNLEDIAQRLTAEKELSDKVRSAMVYPVIVMIMSLGLGLSLSFVVLPKIVPLFSGMKIELPLSTRILIRFSQAVESHGLVFLAVGAVSILSLVWLVRRRFVRPVTHWLFLRLPVIGAFSRNRNLVQFSRTLGSMLKSGLSIDEALAVTEQVQANYYYQRCLTEIRKHVSQGTKLSDNLAVYNRYFPKMTVSLVRVGERSGKLEEELLSLACAYDREVAGAAKTLSVVMEPVLLIIIGLLVGGLALSIITPIYMITGNIY